MISLLIFDLDGTLIDSKKDIAVSLNAALEQEGFAPLSEKTVQDLVGRGAQRLVMEALGNPTGEQLGRVFLNFWNHYDAHCLDRTSLYPGVREFLESCTDIPMAVVTNKPELFSRKILQGLGVASRFRWLIGGDTLGVQKPDPRVLDPIFAELGGKPEALIVGDSEIDIDCGRDAGLWTCAVTYGFRGREELLALKPDFLIDRIEELPGLPVFPLNDLRAVKGAGGE
jgi:2-phosphoglycolate phosphatase